MQHGREFRTLIIQGENSLHGKIEVAGSKNAFHKLIAACMLIPGEHTLRRVPNSSDAESLVAIAERLKARVDWDRPGRVLRIDSRRMSPEILLPELTSKSTGSFLFAGALLARFNEVLIGHPGGDDIGVRPVDRHLEAFRALGAEVSTQGDLYDIRAMPLHAGSVSFERDTVNGTANAVLAALGARGKTTLAGASTDPDVLALLDFLRLAGQRISWHESTLVVDGAGLRATVSVDFEVPPDRNDAATLLVAAALCGDRVEIVGLRGEAMAPLLECLEYAGTRLEQHGASVTVSAPEVASRRAVNVATAPFPGFSTDWGPLVQVLMTQLPGVSTFHETVYSNRFQHVGELQRMGASVEVDSAVNDADYVFTETSTIGQIARFTGPSRLHGAAVPGENWRATAALLLAGMVASGETRLAGADHLSRGYDELIPRLAAAGASLHVGE